MESEGSFPRLQEDYTGLYPEPDESSPHHPSHYKYVKTAYEVTRNFLNFMDIYWLLKKKIIILEITAFLDFVRRLVFKKHYRTRFRN
jgi:hypothetical protein